MADDIWWVERWFRLLDEAGLPVECLGIGKPRAGSFCPLCHDAGLPDAVMRVTWNEATREITFTCEYGCDEELIALRLGAIA